MALAVAGTHGGGGVVPLLRTRAMRRPADGSWQAPSSPTAPARTSTAPAAPGRPRDLRCVRSISKESSLTKEGKPKPKILIGNAGAKLLYGEPSPPSEPRPPYPGTRPNTHGGVRIAVPGEDADGFAMGIPSPSHFSQTPRTPQRNLAICTDENSSSAVSDDDDEDPFGGMQPRGAKVLLNRRTLRLTGTPHGSTPVAQRRRAAGVGETGISTPEVRRLAEHKALKVKGPEVKAVIVEAMQTNRFCKPLEKRELEAIFDSADYYEFEANEVIIRQGELGCYFYVLDYGSCEVKVNGARSGTISEKLTFGGVALVHQCPRTASIVALEDCGMWAAGTMAFRQAIQTNAQWALTDRLRFLDGVGLFDGLTQKQKSRLCEEDGIMCEAFEAGHRVINQGEKPTVMYIVKSGELSMVQAREDFKGESTCIAKVASGDAFGWRAMLYHEVHPVSVISTMQCELLFITHVKLKEIFGKNLLPFLEGSFLEHVLRQMPFAGKLPHSQRHQIVDAMEINSYSAHSRIPDGLVLLAIIDGDCIGDCNGWSKPGSSSMTLKRGHMATPDGTLASLLRAGKEKVGLDRTFLAGEEGCRAATLTQEKLQKVFRQMGLMDLGSAEDAVDHFELMATVMKVPIFRELSEAQAAKLVKALVLRKFTKGAKVFRKGETGSSFFIIWSGGVRVNQDGAERELGRGACFGERAVIYDNEVRSATVEVIQNGTELFSVDRASFLKVVNGCMRKCLQLQMKLSERTIELKTLRHLRLIGSGTFGPVRLVEEMGERVKFVLKRCRKKDGRLPGEAEQMRAVLSEIVKASLDNNTFKSSFVVKVLKTYELDKSLYVLMEPLSGGSLRNNLEMDIALDSQAIKFYGACIILALEALHEHGIVHRNVKPESVLLDSQGYAKLACFGNSKLLGGAYGRTYTVAGDPAYIAPEVIHGKGYGTECDIWSLGVMLYELLCECVPFGNFQAEWTSRPAGRRNSTEVHNCMYTAVLAENLTFPGTFIDEAARNLIKGLLQKEHTMRLGNQLRGWREVKEDLFFLDHESGALFNQVLARQLPAPYEPPTSMWNPQDRFSKESLSDQEELGGASLQHLKTIFRKFDVNGDGRIARHEMHRVLKRIDFKTYTEEVINRMLDSMDVDGDGSVDFEEFISWILSSEAKGIRKTVSLDVHEFD